MSGRPSPFFAKASRSKIQASPLLAGFILLCLSILGFYSTLFTHRAGVAGAKLAWLTSQALGQGAYLLWALIGYRAIRLLAHREDRRPWRYLLVDGLLQVSVCAFLFMFGALFLDLNPGGIVGKSIGQQFTLLFGPIGGMVLSILLMAAIWIWRSEQHPKEWALRLWGLLSSDWVQWRHALAEEKEKKQKPVAKKPLPKVLPGKEAAKTVATNGRKEETRPIVHGKEPFTLPAKPVVAAAPLAAPKPPLKKSADASTEDDEPVIPYVLPSIELMMVPDKIVKRISEEDLLSNSQQLEKTLLDFGIQGKVVEIHPGPIITRYDFTPAPGVKVQAIANLGNDIALAMKALSVRILAPIPGKSAVGIELPNPDRAIVRLREVIQSEEFQSHKSKLAIALGKDAEGHPYIADLAAMPHLLIAGSTGAGKSVCIHSLVMSLLYRATPQEVKLLLIDPKRLELPLYNGIPHLFDPNQNPESVRVITDPKEASKALEGMLKVMDHRFKKFASVMARDIGHYNDMMAEEGRPPESYIVIIIDELADLMAVSPKEVELSIQRLAQMARAVGIHLVLATQRPSVDVITGVIKANLPARIAFRVASQTDSRVILDFMGAESLLGKGDMLFLPPGDPKPTRLQCGFVSTKEVQKITDYVRSQGTPAYERILNPITGSSGTAVESSGNPEEDDMRQGLILVCERKRVSQDLLKAHFGSSARATNLLSLMEVKGFISKPEGTNRWTIYYDRIESYLGQIKNQQPVP